MMYMHKELPEAVQKAISRWYHISLSLISILLLTLAGIQWYTWYSLRKMQQKIAVHRYTMSTKTPHQRTRTTQEKIALARLFAEVCNRTPEQITLTKLVINPDQYIMCQGISADSYAITHLISQFSELGFSHLVRMNVPNTTASETSFEIHCALARK